MEKIIKKEVFQAVVIADNFNENFAPLTNFKPLVRVNKYFRSIRPYFTYFRPFCQSLTCLL